MNRPPLAGSETSRNRVTPSRNPSSLTTTPQVLLDEIWGRESLVLPGGVRVVVKPKWRRTRLPWVSVLEQPAARVRISQMIHSLAIKQDGVARRGECRLGM